MPDAMRSSSAAAASPGGGSCRCASASRNVGRPAGTMPRRQVLVEVGARAAGRDRLAQGTPASSCTVLG